MDYFEFISFRNENLEKFFCLHNGFAGFSYGSPSNPKWISDLDAYEILVKYELLTSKNPLELLLDRSNLRTVLFEGGAEGLVGETGFHMIGFNAKCECKYGDEGLG